MARSCLKSAQSKPSFRLQRKLDQLPARIEQLKSTQKSLQAEMMQPDYFSRDKDSIAADQIRPAETSHELEQACLRREEPGESH